MRGSLLWGFPAAVTSVIRTADTRAFPMQVYVRFCPSYIQYDTVPYRTFGARAQLYTSVFCEQHQHSLAPTKLTQAFHQCHLYRGTMSHPVPVFRSVGTATMPAWEQLRGTHGHAPRPVSTECAGVALDLNLTGDAIPFPLTSRSRTSKEQASEPCDGRKRCCI